MAITTNTSSTMKPLEETNGGKAKQVFDRVKDVATDVVDQAKSAASQLGHKAEDATHAVGGGMQSLAGTMRDRLPQSGPIGAATGALEKGLERTGKYLQQEGLQGMAQDVTKLIRRHPFPAMMLGIGLGFLLARLTIRS
jgi:phage-related protein